MIVAVRVAYTLEQCWHRVPGGTGVAAMRVAEAMAAESDVTLLGVAGRHAHVPSDPWSPPIPIGHLPVGGPLLYDLWLRRGWPKVERATGPIDVAHATTIIPCATNAPLVVTVHDLAFLHDPSQFTRRGNSIFRRSLEQIRLRADLVLCSSQATMDDCVSTGISAGSTAAGPPRGRVDQGRCHRGCACQSAVPAARALPAVRGHGRAAQEPARVGRGRRPTRRAASAGRGRRRGLGRRGNPIARRCPLHRLRAGSRPRWVVCRRRGVLLSQRARGLRPAGARSDGTGHAGGHQPGNCNGGDSRRCSSAGRSAGSGRHRPRDQRGARPPRRPGRGRV